MGVEMNYQVPVIYEEGVLRPLTPLDLPEHTRLTVTVLMPEDTEQAPFTPPRAQCPTRPQPLSQLDPLIGTMPAGGDALHNSEALYDEEW